MLILGASIHFEQNTLSFKTESSKETVLQGINSNETMNSIGKITHLGIPAILGLGAAWLATRILRNEANLATRKVELELQLGAKSLINKRYKKDL